MEVKQGNYEENLTKALMRGVCALNMEAMSVLHINDGPENTDTPVIPESIRASVTSNRPNSSQPARPSSGHLIHEQNINPNNSPVHIPSPSGYNPTQAYLSKPASNVFLNTVNSLEDFSSTQSRKKLTVRNSAEFNGGLAGRRDHLSETNSNG